jgi:hypothetical protein
MKLTLFYNLCLTKVHINLENYVIHSRTLCQICLFEFIRKKGGVKFVKHFKEGHKL